MIKIQHLILKSCFLFIFLFLAFIIVGKSKAVYAEWITIIEETCLSDTSVLHVQWGGWSVNDKDLRPYEFSSTFTFDNTWVIKPSNPTQTGGDPERIYQGSAKGTTATAKLWAPGTSTSSPPSAQYSFVLTCGPSYPTPSYPTPSSGQPDLWVGFLGLDKSDYAPGETATATIDVNNLSTTTQSGAFTTMVYFDRASDPACSTSGDASFWSGGLAASGKIDDQKVTFTVPSAAGTYTLGVKADYECAVAESDETNNFRSLTYTVGGGSTPPTIRPPAAYVKPFVDTNKNGLFDGGEKITPCSAGNYKVNGASRSLCLIFSTSPAPATVAAELVLNADWTPTKWGWTKSFRDDFGNCPCTSSDGGPFSYTGSSTDPVATSDIGNGDDITIYLGVYSELPLTPSNFGASTSCDPATDRTKVTFTFTDNSDNEDKFFLDVDLTTVPRFESPWGYKELPAAPGTGSKVTFVWSSDSAGQLSGGPPVVPDNSGKYYARVVAVNAKGQSSHLYLGGGTAEPGSILTAADCTPPEPSNLGISPNVCDTTLFENKVGFNWLDRAGTEDGYWLDVATDSTFGTFGRKVLGPVTSSAFIGTWFTWTPGSPLDSGDSDHVAPGDQRSPAPSKTYYWRLTAFNAGGSQVSSFVYPPTTNPFAPTASPGTPFTTPVCAPPDLAVDPITFDKNPAVYGPSEPITATVVVRNIGTANASSVEVRFFANLPSDPDCSTPLPTAAKSLGAINGGASVSTAFLFTTPSSKAAYTARAIAGCSGAVLTADNNPLNNVGTGAYSVNIKSWFETIGADIGSGGDISVSQDPLPLSPPRYIADYLGIASKTISLNALINPRGGTAWRITNYADLLNPKRADKKPLSHPVYATLSDLFKKKAVNNLDAIEECALSILHNGYNYCSHSVILDGGSFNGNAVWFINGDVTITKDLTIGSTGTLVFMVGDNDSTTTERITINRSVIQADGIYITNGIFDDNGPIISEVDVKTLNITGAVYAKTMNLARVLGGPGCGTPLSVDCDNAKTPAEIITYSPKYLIALKDILGFHSFSWNELAP